MRESGPSLKPVNLWAKREAQFLAVLERALQLLQRESFIEESEVGLNRRLYFCLLQASQELYPNSEISPISECNNQPDPDDYSRSKREQKRPDFQWIYRDKYESNPRHSSKQFVVECKRLGKSSRADWVLNLNYVSHGICRFHDKEWAYAKRFPSGAMVGYWQSLEGKQILMEVNAECSNRSLPNLVLIQTETFCHISHLEHTFDRFFDISPFKLCHFWVDLR